MSDVTLLKVHQDNTADDELLENFSITRMGVLMATATARGGYQGGQASSAIGVAIYLRTEQDPETPWNENQVIAQDTTGEAQSQSITFHCSATATRVLAPGRYNLRVLRTERRINRARNLMLDLVILSATS
jgi:hypothetical protein